MEGSTRGLGRGWKAEGSGPSGGGACAACKHQRRKCTPDCPLAPYFPPDQPQLFHNAHRLFGVSNILKILRRVHPATWPDAMRSIISEANIRQLYPVNGCVAVVYHLCLQIRRLQRELDAVNAQLAAVHVATPRSADRFASADPNLQYLLAGAPDKSPAMAPFAFSTSRPSGKNTDLCFDDFADQQSRIDSDEPHDSSLDLESSVTNTTHPAIDELISMSHLQRGASACFPLTRAA